MFGFYCARPPTEEMTKAYQLIHHCETYIFFSTDSTGDYLEESLKWIDGIAPTLAITEGNTTSSSGDFVEAHQFHSVIGAAIRWLQANRSLSQDEIKSKYPSLVADGLAEAKRDKEDVYNCRTNWTYDQMDRDLPNLLSPYIHHDRLGDVIDEVLGFTGTEEAAKHSKKAKCGIATRYSDDNTRNNNL
jgi:hypothetical protein